MSNCAPKFDSTIPVDCVIEIVKSIAGGGPRNGENITKALWVAGCVTTSLGLVGEPDVDLDAAGEASKLLATLEPADGSSIQAAAIPPEVWAILLQILLKWLSGNLQR